MKYLGLDPKKVTKLRNFMLIWFNMFINLYVPAAPLRNLLLQIIIKTRSGVLLVIHLIPTREK